MRRLLFAVLSSAAVLGLSACGDDSSSGGAPAETTADATTALREAGKTKAAVQAAMSTYANGDRAAAEEQVAEAYVSHFEDVEHALEERDAELNERLEEAISGDLRADIKAGKPEAEVRRA